MITAEDIAAFAESFDPDELVCERCGDLTSYTDSPDGTHCPDCHDRQQYEEDAA